MHQLLKYDPIFQIKLLLLFSTKPKNANEQILANKMYELQIVGNASILCFCRHIVIGSLLSFRLFVFDTTANNILNSKWLSIINMFMHFITKIKIRLWSRIIISWHMVYAIYYMSNRSMPYLVQFNFCLKSSSVFVSFWYTFQVCFFNELRLNCGTLS